MEEYFKNYKQIYVNGQKSCIYLAMLKIQATTVQDVVHILSTHMSIFLQKKQSFVTINIYIKGIPSNATSIPHLRRGSGYTGGDSDILIVSRRPRPL
jgi:hypothetical protein